MDGEEGAEWVGRRGQTVVNRSGECGGDGGEKQTGEVGGGREEGMGGGGRGGWEGVGEKRIREQPNPSVQHTTIP